MKNHKTKPQNTGEAFFVQTPSGLVTVRKGMTIEDVGKIFINTKGIKKTKQDNEREKWIINKNSTSTLKTFQLNFKNTILEYVLRIN